MSAPIHETPVVWGRRPPAAADEPFLFRLFCTTREDELALWDAPADVKAAFLRMQFDAQRAHYGRHFPTADHDIVTLDGEPAGRILVDRSRDEIRVVDLAILTERRNAGIGSRLMRSLLDESSATGKPVRVHAFKPSRAVDFYERMGFVRTGDEGPYCALEWNPAAARVTA